MKTLVIGSSKDNIGEEFALTIPARNEADGIDEWTVLGPAKGAVDVTRPYFIDNFLHLQGPFDEIVYSAGLNELCWAENLHTNNVMQDLWRVNVEGVTNILGIHKKMYPDSAFSAVVVTSDAAINPMRGSTAYCASKAAANQVVRCLAREWGAEGFRVNAVAPGMVADTPMTQRMDQTIPEFRGWSPEFAAQYEGQQLGGRGRITKAEVVDAIWFLLRGPEYVNGVILDLCGTKG